MRIEGLAVIDPIPDPTFEAALRDWLRDEAGIEEPRRLVRTNEDGVLVSKFEPGFASRLHELLALLPGLFDEDDVIARYERAASEAPLGTTRVDAWHAALHEALREAGERHAIPDLRQAEVRAGIDSVRVVLDAVLWSAPSVATTDYEPLPGEREAYIDGVDSLADGRDLFTRYYGAFHGHAVRNHCPGAAHARLMLAHAWRACTGTPPPAR